MFYFYSISFLQYFVSTVFHFYSLLRRVFEEEEEEEEEQVLKYGVTFFYNYSQIKTKNPVCNLTTQSQDHRRRHYSLWEAFEITIPLVSGASFVLVYP